MARYKGKRDVLKRALREATSQKSSSAVEEPGLSPTALRAGLARIPGPIVESIPGRMQGEQGYKINPGKRSETVRRILRATSIKGSK